MNDNVGAKLIESLLKSEAYPHPVSGEVELIETHISWVLLAGEFAYKIKKPIRNAFLDYSDLSLRKHYCEEELRLNRRFATAIYLDVVAIAEIDGVVRFSNAGEPMGGGKTLEYAVQMKRFTADSLLKDQLRLGCVHLADIQRLAKRIACFHADAAKADCTSRFGTADLICAEALDNCRELIKAPGVSSREVVQMLRHWTVGHFEKHRASFCDRKNYGHVRECHGDLHLGNIVSIDGDLIPFDGIEFAEEFRWIDTLSDAAFTAMDFAACGRFDLCHSFVNSYFEASGDYAGIHVLQWYLVYRAMVRAKVAALRAQQARENPTDHEAAENDLESHLMLARRFSFEHREPPRLWITYGLSGSGKTCGSEQLLQRHAAVRVRADVERKRLAGIRPNEKVTTSDRRSAHLYSVEMTQATYQRLADLAAALLAAGESVIVDATCLKRWQRDLFRSLAERQSVPFRILAFHAEHAVLRQRLNDRMKHGHDASDADVDVLEMQIADQQHLDADEMTLVGSIEE